MPDSQIELDYEAYRQLLELWKGENPIKTRKLQVLLAVNALLLTGVQLTGGFTVRNWPFYLGGAVLSLVWVLSIGRTSLFQHIWQLRIREYAAKYPADPRFHALTYGERELAQIRGTHAFLRIAGGVSSKYYLVGAPIVSCVAWAILLVLAWI